MGVVGRASVGSDVDAVVGLGVTIGVAWRTAVGGVGRTVRSKPAVGVARLAAGGSGFDVSRLRGLSTVAVARGATGATTGAAGS